MPKNKAETETANIKRIMIMAGGTGGHVFPGIALAQAFAKHGIETHWLGTEGGLEENWVIQAELPFSAISIKGLRGNGLKGWLFAPFKVFNAFLQARRVIKAQSPGLVIGMGGFVCGPGGLAARSLGLPLFLHEQNAIAGLTNKLLAPLARKVFCGLEVENWRATCQVIGNPVRSDIEQVPVINPQQANHILVIGGSRGAQALNENLPQALALLTPEQRPTVLHQTGQASVASTQALYQDLKIEGEVVAFIDDMAQAYQQATLVVARSGALTVSELMCAGRPAVLIPFPFAVDDHQTANAMQMVKLNCAQLIQQVDLTPQNLAQAIVQGLERNDSIKQSLLLKENAHLNAADTMAAEILEICNKNR